MVIWNTEPVWSFELAKPPSPLKHQNHQIQWNTKTVQSIETPKPLSPMKHQNHQVHWNTKTVQSIEKSIETSKPSSPLKYQNHPVPWKNTFTKSIETPKSSSPLKHHKPPSPLKHYKPPSPLKYQNHQAQFLHPLYWNVPCQPNHWKNRHRDASKHILFIRPRTTNKYFSDVSMFQTWACLQHWNSTFSLLSLKGGCLLHAVGYLFDTLLSDRHYIYFLFLGFVIEKELNSRVCLQLVFMFNQIIGNEK